MREILFRGKIKDSNDWVEGAYYKRTEYYGEPSEEHYIITTTEDLSYDQALDYYNVIPETVGKYTGFKDMNGKMIFEGDIVHNHIGDKKIVDCVIFENGCFCMDRQAFNYEFTYQDTSKFEVIGNIHDNPEILENVNKTQRY